MCSEREKFDESFKMTVCDSVRILSQDTDESYQNNISVSSEEIGSAIRLAHKGKASGEDGIFYEHIMFAGEILHKVLAILFSAMINLAYVPAEMKKGAIITLYKGGNKSKDNPDSYRAITLSSVLLKLLERILLTRIQLFDTVSPPIHAMQGGGVSKECRLSYDFISIT